MDAFEQLAVELFREAGYWVRTGFKVELTGDEKVRIGRHSSPRWEIDLLAWHAVRGELLALECKSYLDSGGVHAAHFQTGSRYAHRYKLFHDAVLRETVLGRIKLQCIETGLCPGDAALRLGLIAGHITKYNTPLVAEIFSANDWLLFGPDWLRKRLSWMAAGSYENSTAAVVAKLLLRQAAPALS